MESDATSFILYWKLDIEKNEVDSDLIFKFCEKYHSKKLSFTKLVLFLSENNLIDFINKK